jgi:hypothetical protein
MATATWPRCRAVERCSSEVPREARRRKRLKVSLPVHVRPFDARFAEIEDIGQVVDFTRDGLYFVTSMPHYFVGMRLIVTFPYGDNVSARRKFLASIVRLEHRGEQKRGVALRLVLIGFWARPKRFILSRNAPARENTFSVLCWRGGRVRRTFLPVKSEGR